MPGEERFSREPPPMPTPRRFDEDGDATRRTWLATERTVLAWLRTGLTATAGALAVGKLLPELRDGGHTWPYVALGVGYAVLGVLLVVYGVRRGQEVDRAIREGAWVAPAEGTMRLLAGITVVLGIASAVVVVVDT